MCHCWTKCVWCKLTGATTMPRWYCRVQWNTVSHNTSPSSIKADVTVCHHCVSLHLSVNFIGLKFRREFNTGSVFQRSGACMVWHRHTSPETLHLSTEVDACRRLRSASTSTLVIPATRRSTLGDRACPVAAARAWNSLPPSVRSTSSLASVCLHLKTHLFAASFPRWHLTSS